MQDSDAQEEQIGDGNPWQKGHPAVHIERLVDIDGIVRESMLRHPTYPFQRWVPAASDDLEHALRCMANDYLERALAREFLRIVARLRAADDSKNLIGWLGKLHTLHDANPAPPPQHRYGAFWIERVVNESRIDRTAVLLAGLRIFDGKGETALGGSCGLRVVVHVGPDVDGTRRARITGMSMHGLPHLLKAIEEPLHFQLDGTSLRGLAATVLLQARRAFNLSRQTLTGLRFHIEGDGLTISGLGVQDVDRARRVVAWQAEYVKSERQFEFIPGPVVEQAAAAQEAASRFWVFGRDAASQGSAGQSARCAPGERDAVLNCFRRRETLIQGGELAHFGADGQCRFEVMKSPVTDRGHADEVLPVPDEATGNVLRSDDLAAVHAFERARELFERLDSYAFQPSNVFRQAQLPMRLRHRAVLPGGTSGNTVNAMVRPDSPGQGIESEFDPSMRPRLEVLFGSAALPHRHSEYHGSGRCGPAQYLGLAADPRWAWHEFGHVLSFAASGELEFPFAHSAGDALAAIIYAPDSQFDSADTQAGLTYPWVQMRRRHDRRANAGWCWCGRRNRLRLSRAARLPRPFSDYVEEQMLSSSLYMLYEVLGGASHDDGDASALATRRRASDYSIYLVMRAMASIGPWEIVPVASADQFVSALVDADVATHQWDVPTPWYEHADVVSHRASSRCARIGGTAHKVVRWAFENQGLFAVDDPERSFEGEGKPPRVDIYIPGRGHREFGGYAPVSLNWSSDPEQPASWHSGGIILKDGCLQIIIRNRGEEPSGAVYLRLWVGWMDEGKPCWLGVAVEHEAGELTGSGSTKSFGFELPSEASALGPCTLCVLVEISCAADRANSDPAAGLACAVADMPTCFPTTLVDLVANDNNLGLALFALF